MYVSVWLLPLASVVVRVSVVSQWWVKATSCRAPRRPMMTSLASWAWPAPETVSYTHLDVYKRQARTGMSVASVIDLRSDTLTQPSAGMRAAMTSASVLSLIHI